MIRKSLCRWAALAALSLSAGCCSWCERHCSTCHPANNCCAPCQPACCQPACCQPCAPVAAPSYAPPAGGTWTQPRPAGAPCCN
jgi:hypothetical protein